MSLKKKRVLITAGPTWVPIDKVRVISNIATGETGILLAKRFKQLGAKVTLVLGSVEACCLDKPRPSLESNAFNEGRGKNIKLIRFKFFNELRDIVVRELKSKKYDIVIHSAAVSDYRPAKSYSYKIESGIRGWKLKLVPTEKIIDLIRRIAPSLFIVGFKFEPRATKNILIKEAKKLMQHAGLDLAVANSIKKNRYIAYILKSERTYGPVLNKGNLVEELTNIIREKIWMS